MSPLGVGIGSTILWTEIAQAMRKDGHEVPDKAGPETTRVIRSAARCALEGIEEKRDYNQLVRQLDVALNGEKGAAKQAALCDIVGQMEAHVRVQGAPLLEAAQALARDAERFRLISRIWDGQKTSQSQRFLELLGMEGDVTVTLAAIVDVALGVQWRWVDQKGDAMTRWSKTPVPEVRELTDIRGTMRVETRKVLA